MDQASLEKHLIIVRWLAIVINERKDTFICTSNQNMCEFKPF